MPPTLAASSYTLGEDSWSMLPSRCAILIGARSHQAAAEAPADKDAIRNWRRIS
jgi:hypothetical protein